MISFLVRRLIMTVPVLVGVATFTFLLIHFVPGDPIDLMLGESASYEDKLQLREEMGLNQPLLTQYKDYWTKLSQLDLGRSYLSRRPVFDEINDRVGATVELALAAIFISLFVGVPLGIIAAVKQYTKFDHSISVLGLLGMSLPGFWVGPMLILIFSIKLGWFPVSERGGLESLILPAVSLGLPLAAIMMRMTRASMLDVIKEDYIRTARSKGMGNFLVYSKHALRNALMPVITILGIQLGALLTGTVITETIFDWPGIGTLFFSSIQQRNYPLVQGCVLLISTTYVVVNLATDVMYGVVNPKVRVQ
ncbi:MAG: glutathione ABC transporter permease GsiC [Bdellovibrionales bacterium CG10_big_fil_rev_8_21_14_0_10_45_34]|nr:MAG: glutathione ABC transporter permease GsiC [Bdellovibrionales bacterium CG10_big_fil_rev_8_21_14_0_10_45_34]